MPSLNSQAARVGSLKKTGLKLRISGGRGTGGVEARLCGRRGTGRGKDRSNSSVGDGAMESGVVIHGGLAQACDPGATLIATSSDLAMGTIRLRVDQNFIICLVTKRGTDSLSLHQGAGKLSIS